MFASTLLLTAALSLLPTALGHARITSPPIRAPGKAFQAKCGPTSFNSVVNDETGHIEEQEPVNSGCELTLCRGMLFEDQPAKNVVQVKPGDAMTMAVDCTIPHGGPANVSLVDTTVGGSGEVIGGFLTTFDDFCPTDGETPADQAQTKFTLPSANVVGDKCQKAGDCVVQLFWATPDFSQNYYYCVDVAMAANNVATPPAAATSAVVQQATSSAVVAPATSAAPVLATSAAEPATTSSAVTSAIATSAVAASSESAVAPASASTTALPVGPTTTALTTLSSDTGASVTTLPASTPTAATDPAAVAAPASTPTAATDPAAVAAPAVTPAAQPAAAEPVTVTTTRGFSTVVRFVTDAPAASPSSLGTLAQTSGARRGRSVLWFYI